VARPNFLGWVKAILTLGISLVPLCLSAQVVELTRNIELGIAEASSVFLDGSYEGAFAMPLRIAQADSQDHARNDIQQKATEAARAFSGGNLSIASDMFRRVLVESRRTLGPTDVNTIAIMNNLAAVYRAQRDINGAERLFREAVEASRLGLGPEDPRTLTTVSNLARLYQDEKRYADAEPLLVEVLAGRRKRFGEDDPQTQTTKEKLAEVYAAQGRATEAEAIFREILARRTQVIGWNNADTLRSSRSLTQLFRSQGRFGEAAAILEDAVSALLQTRGKYDPVALIQMNELSVVYLEQGRPHDAEPLVLDILTAFKSSLGEEREETLSVTANLAGVYLAEDRLVDARALFETVLSVRQKVSGDRSRETAIARINLAWIYFKQTRYDDALRLLSKAYEALALNTAIDPLAITALNNIGLIYIAQKDFAQAEALYTKVVEARRSVFGEDHPLTLSSIDNLVYAYEGLGRFQEAVVLLNGTLPRWRARLSRELEHSPVANAKSAASAQIGITWDTAVSLALLSDTPEASSLAANAVLGFKYFRGEYEGELRRAAQDLTPNNKEIVVRLRRALVELRSLETDFGGNSEKAELLRVKRDEVRELEQRLQSLVPGFGASAQSIDWHDVARSLGDNTVLLEYRILRPVNLSSVNDPQPERIVGIMVRSDAEPLIRDLGSLAALRADLSLLINFEEEDESYQVARIRVFRALVSPFGEALSNAKSVYIAPDGLLHRLPFEVLKPRRETDYWIQSQRLHVVPSGRILVAPTRALATGETYLFGAPDYGSASGQQTNVQQKSASSMYDKTVARACNGGKDLPPLPASRDEVVEVAALLQNNGLLVHKPLLGTEASKLAIEAIEVAPRVLHLASHGCVTSSNFASDPLQRAQIALANANRGNEGVLSGAEAALLKLDSTALVVLSACDTAKGDLENGEGVMSLAYGFRLAGARNVLMTLSRVNDTKAKDFVVGFYRHWLEDRTSNPEHALYLTKMDWIARQEPDRAWAAFVLTENENAH
jgi:CHAT domain-containing protein/Tfp pilus assembly protein PilF